MFSIGAWGGGRIGRNTRRMFVIVAASRACKILQNHNFSQKVKGHKSDHALLPKGIQIEDLTQASCHA